MNEKKCHEEIERAGTEGRIEQVRGREEDALERERSAANGTAWKDG